MTSFPQTPEQHVEQITALLAQAREMRKAVGGWFAANVSPGMVREQKFCIYALEDLDGALDAALAAARAEVERLEEEQGWREWEREVKAREYAR